jgi:hypothetical protein
MVRGMQAGDGYSASAYPEDEQRIRQLPGQLERQSGQAAQPGRRARPATSRVWAALAWVAGVAAVFTLYLRIKLATPPTSDTANNALQAWDMLHGHLLLHGWIIGDATYYTFELPLMAIVEAFFGLHTMAVHVSMALVYLIVTGCAAAVAVLDSRGLSRAARAGVVVAVLAAPLLVISDLWIPLQFPDHFGTAVFLMVPCLLIGLSTRPREERVRPGELAPPPAKQAGRRFTVPLLCVLLCVILCAGQIGDVTVRYVYVPAIIGVCAYQMLAARQIKTRDAAYLVAAVASLPLATVVRAVMRHFGSYLMVSPRTQLAPDTQWAHNWVLTWHSIRMLFGVVGEPGFPPVGSTAIFGWACLVLAAAGMLRVIWNWRRASRAEQVLLLAVAANVVAYAFSTLPSPQAPHEIAVVLPAGAVLGARALVPARIPGRWLAAAACAALVAALLPLSLVAATRPPVVPPRTQLATWLQAHGLRYGLAGYWDSSIVNLLTGGRVQVRAVALSGGKITPYPWESSPAWYDPARYRADFVVIGNSDGSLEQDSEHFFGRPASVHRVAGYTVLIYDKNVLDVLKPASRPPLS